MYLLKRIIFLLFLISLFQTNLFILKLISIILDPLKMNFIPQFDCLLATEIFLIKISVFIINHLLIFEEVWLNFMSKKFVQYYLIQFLNVKSYLIALIFAQVTVKSWTQAFVLDLQSIKIYGENRNLKEKLILSIKAQDQAS